MNHMKVVAHPTLDGAFTFQLIVPRRHPKLALNRSHYLLANEKRYARLEVNGVERDLVAMVKIWAPVGKGDRRDEARRFLKQKVVKGSPMLI